MLNKQDTINKVNNIYLYNKAILQEISKNENQFVDSIYIKEKFEKIIDNINDIGIFKKEIRI